MSSYDVTILGGGLSGLTLATQLAKQDPSMQILVLERRSFPVNEGAYKVGESTIEVGAHYLAEEVGLKKHLLEHHLPKFGLRFFFDGKSGPFSDAVEVGLSDFFPMPGYQIDRGRLENHLRSSLPDGTVKVREGTWVKQIELASDGGFHRITHENEDGTGRRVVSTRWVVDASGRAGLLKRQLDLREEVSHHVNAAWFRIGAEVCIDSWCEDPDWRARAGRVPRRWLSTNHLLGRGYWIWIIPLASGKTSIGIVADPRLHPLGEFSQFDRALDWITRHEPRCGEWLATTRDKLEDFRAIKRIAHGCKQVYSAERWAITGEAGVFLDPLYSPGIDYIAMANTQIASLIEQDRAGRPINLVAPRYQGLFLQLFHDNLATYQDQYPLFGNARVMSCKYVWDYALYWSFPALLYFNGKLTDPAFFARVGESIEKIRTLNRGMQDYLRDWDEAEPACDARASFINQNEITILSQLNGELRDCLDDDALEARFRRNLRILEELAGEIRERGGEFTRQEEHGPDTLARPNQTRLVPLFEALGQV